jgi:hypothetical protein
MKTFLSLLNKLLNINSEILQSRLDLYVASKRPTSSTDVERILKEYERCTMKSAFYS